MLGEVSAVVQMSDGDGVDQTIAEEWGAGVKYSGWGEWGREMPGARGSI